MKSYRKELIFNVKSRRAYIDVTEEVVAALRESGIKEGLLLCNAMHITASVYINDHESTAASSELICLITEYLTHECTCTNR